jgi:Calcineurin-like phosphoesterase
MLAAIVGDPDADPMDVTFFGRAVPAAGDAGEVATLVVVPDPQKYTRTARAASTYREQMRWIVRSRERLAIAFVIAVGDLVQRPDSAIQWKRAGDAWRILDEARVPYSVVPGNHDMTSDGAADMYDRLFPPERFADEPWYGGWMGDPHDGIADPSDRGNKDSYQLFFAAGMDFLILNLEVDLPRQAVRWAADVVHAHPDRHVILVTHRWMGDDGVRWRRPL